MIRRIIPSECNPGDRAALDWCGAVDQALPEANAVAGGASASDETLDADPSGGALARFHQVVGFTLVELLIAVVVIGALAAIAIPSYRQYIERAQVVKTLSDLKLLESEINLYFVDNQRYPVSLDDIGRGNMLDLWGNPYQYTNISLDLEEIEKVTGQAKKAAEDEEKVTGQDKKAAKDEAADEAAAKENSGVGKFRSYHGTKPINTDFDIYSMGPDGKSARPLTSKNSHDDIIRANNGGYYGRASEF
ncbi:MAG: prepilin-type N-terminal cleavage/methylation domain-containing protein [Pseudomonadota bacterium]